MVSVPLTSLQIPNSSKGWHRLVQKIWLGIFLAALGLTPWFFWPASPVVYEVPRVFLWLGSIELLLLLCCAWGFLSVLHNKEFFKLNPSMIGVSLCFIGIAFVSSFSNGVIMASLLGNYFRIDGLLTLIHLWLLAVMVGLVWPTQAKLQVLFTRIVTISASGISLWAVSSTVLSYFSFHYLGTWPKAVSISFGNPNLLAGFLLICLPIWWQNWQTINTERNYFTPTRLVTMLAGLLLGLALLATQALSAIMGIGLCIILFWLLSKPTPLTVGLAVVAVTLAIAGFWGLAFYHGTLQFETESRYRIAHKLSLAIQDKPWLGWGWSQVSTAFAAHPWPFPILHDVYVDKAHSHFWEVLTTTGIIGLTTYVFLIGLHVQTLSKYLIKSSTFMEKKWLTMWLVVVLIFIYHSQTNVVGIQEEIFFWISLGITFKVYQPRVA